MARIGYARVSTTDQNLDRQLEQLKDCEKVFQDKISGKNTKRPALQEMLAYVREGDCLIVSSISRLARSTRDLLDIVGKLQDQGVQFISLKENIDTTSPAGKFMLTVFAALAELEREQILERQAEGIAIARAKGKHLGRPPLQKPKDFDRIYREWKAGKRTAVSCWKDLDISKSSFYKLVKAEDS